MGETGHVTLFVYYSGPFDGDFNLRLAVVVDAEIGDAGPTGPTYPRDATFVAFNLDTEAETRAAAEKLARFDRLTHILYDVHRSVFVKGGDPRPVRSLPF